MEWHLKDNDKTALLALARDSLVSHFKESEEQTLKNFEMKILPRHPALAQKLPCFVSLHTRTKELRGCIGILETKDALYENTAHYVLQAAMAGPRFPRVKQTEVANLRIGISVLGPSKEITSLQEVEIGKHGLVVQSGNRRGVLLAKVAVEQGWDQEEFLAQTCLKAGLAPEMVYHYKMFVFEEISFED